MNSTLREEINEIIDGLQLGLLYWQGKMVSGVADMPFDNIVRINRESMDITLNNLEKLIKRKQLEARIEEAENCETIALIAATRTPHDTLGVMLALERYIKELKEE